MKDSVDFRRAIVLARRFVSYGPRTELQVSRRLKKLYSQEVIAAVLAELVETGEVDDEAFALLWIANRNSSRPRSLYLIKKELYDRGIGEQIIEKVVQNIDEEDAAYRAASTFSRKLSPLRFSEFERKLWGYMRRRGFTNDLIRTVTISVWKDRNPQNENFE